jgi:hypothetical protein
MMEAVHISEMLVYYNETTQRYILDGCNFLCTVIKLTTFIYRNSKRKRSCLLYLFKCTAYQKSDVNDTCISFQQQG